MPLPLLDPDASLWRQVLPGRALGCVVYSANEVVRPGVVRHSANNRWIFGEPDCSLSTCALAARGSRTPSPAIDVVLSLLRRLDRSLRPAH
jgi:hypothetical protein